MSIAQSINHLEDLRNAYAKAQGELPARGATEERAALSAAYRQACIRGYASLLDALTEKEEEARLR